MASTRTSGVATRHSTAAGTTSWSTITNISPNQCFSEYGCNEVLPRNFDEVPVLYTNDMIDVFSGGLVYEFTQEPNNYGLVKVLSNGDIKVLRTLFS